MIALDETLITIPDTFLGTYSAANLPVKGKNAFLCDAVWASIGHSVAAAVGASFGSADVRSSSAATGASR